MNTYTHQSGLWTLRKNTKYKRWKVIYLLCGEIISRLPLVACCPLCIALSQSGDGWPTHFDSSQQQLSSFRTSFSFSGPVQHILISRNEQRIYKMNQKCEIFVPYLFMALPKHKWQVVRPYILFPLWLYVT